MNTLTHLTGLWGYSREDRLWTTAPDKVQFAIFIMKSLLLHFWSSNVVMSWDVFSIITGGLMFDIQYTDHEPKYQDVFQKRPQIYIIETKWGLHSLATWHDNGEHEHGSMTDANKGSVCKFRELLVLLLCLWLVALRWTIYLHHLFYFHSTGHTCPSSGALEMLWPLLECKSVLLWFNRIPY